MRRAETAAGKILPDGLSSAIRHSLESPPPAGSRRFQRCCAECPITTIPASRAAPAARIFRVSFYWGECRSAGGLVPDELVEQITPHHAAMRGTTSKPARCVALLGEIGGGVRCTMYEQRSSHLPGVRRVVGARRTQSALRCRPCRPWPAAADPAAAAGPGARARGLRCGRAAAKHSALECALCHPTGEFHAGSRRPDQSCFGGAPG